MQKLFIVFFAVVACVAAEPKPAHAVVAAAAPLAAAPVYAAAYNLPVASAYPAALFNAPLNSAIASQRLDLYNRYNAGFLPFTENLITPAAYTAAYPIASAGLTLPAFAPAPAALANPVVNAPARFVAPAFPAPVAPARFAAPVLPAPVGPARLVAPTFPAAPAVAAAPAKLITPAAAAPLFL